MSAAAIPCTALAQSRVVRVGFLGAGSAAGYVAEVEAIRARLRDLGYVEGRNLALEFRWSDGDPAKLERMAGELVALRVDMMRRPRDPVKGRRSSDLLSRTLRAPDMELQSSNALALAMADRLP